ncbi:MAG TPA: hypothetical protein VF916_07330 [Ktedonobacterales bacterium]
MQHEADDGGHIWLRQSVRFAVGDQRRTIEIALPLPIGASHEEIERLLQEADVGMTRLTQHLDRRIAAALDADTVEPVAAPLSAAVAPSLQRSDTVRAAETQEQPPHEAAAQDKSTDEVERPQRAATMLPAREAQASTPTMREGRDATSAPDAPVRSDNAPAPPPASPRASSETPVPPPAARQTAPEPVAPNRAAAPAASLTRPEFLAQTRALGLTPPQVMERLGVRSLDGLNLDEALGLLRRQLTPSSAAPEPSRATGAPASGDDAPKPLAAPAPEPPSGTFFDEEDDYDLTVIGTPEEDDDAESTYGIAQDEDEEGTLAHATDDEPDDLRLDEVPDFGAERGATPAPQRAQSRSTAETRDHDGPAGADALTLPQRARARELVARLRAVTPGGSATRAQHTAFANIVADQLGAAPAAALTRGLWGQAPERLGTDQLNAVIQWGKEDAFAEEAPAVAALLRAEHASAQASPAPAPSAAPRPTRAAERKAKDVEAGGVA